MTCIEETIEELVVLRNYHQESLRVLDGRIKKLKSLSAPDLKKKGGKKKELAKKYDNYLTTGKWKKQKNVSDSTFSGKLTPSRII